MTFRRVWVDNWQMQCCGDPFRVGSTVSWTVMRPDLDYLASVLGEEQAAGFTGAEEHHGGDEGRGSSVVTGIVVSIDTVSSRFASVDGIAGQPLYPVADTAIVAALTAADGWESDVNDSDDGRRFVGYIVGVDVAEGV